MRSAFDIVYKWGTDRYGAGTCDDGSSLGIVDVQFADDGELFALALMSLTRRNAHLPYICKKISERATTRVTMLVSKYRVVINRHNEYRALSSNSPSARVTKHQQPIFQRDLTFIICDRPRVAHPFRQTE